jgi:hypothetical protein
MHCIIVSVLRFLVVVLTAVLSWLLWWEATTYRQGTAMNIEVRVIQQPFIDGDSLVYRWEGDLVRSCEITILRRFIDSDGVETRLVSASFPPSSISGQGRVAYEVSIDVPRQIATGPAIYQATEVPRCTLLQRWFPVAIDYPPVEFTVTR